MGDAQQDGKKRVSYEQWTKQETDVLLELMVDATSRGWRDNSGVFSKQTVEERILPVLNSRLGCQKNYNNYQSRLRWFKNRWLSYSTLLRFSSGFGFDPITKTFTANNEVWEDYLKAHPKDVHLRHGVFNDYEDLEIAVGNGVAVGKNAIGLGTNTDARTLRVDEVRDLRIDDLNYDSENEIYVVPTQSDLPVNQTTPTESQEDVNIPKRRTQSKRGRTEYEGSSNSSGHTAQSGVLKELSKLTTTFEAVYGLLEKRDREKTFTAWDAIKEVPDLDENIRLSAFNLLDTKTKKDGFMKMSPGERRNWILSMMQKK